MLRSLINEYLIENVHDGNVAVLFSGGLDSLSILLSCLDVGINPHLYTFRLSNYESEDSKSSKRIADIFDLPLTEVILDVENINLVEDIKTIMNMFNVKKKTQIQCIQPFLYVIPQIQERYILSGLCADDLYGTARSIAKLSKNKDIFDETRRQKHFDIESSSYKFIEELCRAKNRIFIAPYKQCDDIYNLMINKSYKELHSPKQKNITLTAYKDYIDKYNLYRRNSNLQCDSKIREWHNTLLLDKDVNTLNHKGIVGVYNNIYKLKGGNN